MRRSLGPFPAVTDYVTYLEACAQGTRTRFDTAATSIEPVEGGWRILIGEDRIDCEHVVVATGPDLEPVIPRWPGDETFTGRLVHAGEFRRLADADGQDVLVVGPGNSGVDLLNHLVRRQVGALWLSSRGGMNILPQRVAGVPMHPVAVASRYLPVAAQDVVLRGLQRAVFGDLTHFGYPRSSVGAIQRARVDGVAPAIDDGFVAALKSGRVQMRPAVERIDGADVQFVDETSCRPDLIVCATGYRPGLAPLVGGIVELDRLGMPPFTGSHSSPQLPGLWFFGLNRSPYGNMHIRRREARQLARRITSIAPAGG